MPDSRSADPRAEGSLLRARTESHSDVADSKPARAHQAALTEQLLAGQLLRRLREAEGPVRLGRLQEEWVSVDDGLVHELSLEVVPTE
jgi:hypothetical protein